MIAFVRLLRNGLEIEDNSDAGGPRQTRKAQREESGRGAILLSYLAMPSLCVFSKQDDALVGWPDAISADPLIDLETYQASFRVEFDQALNAHIACMIEDAVSSLVVSKRCYNAFRPCEGSHIVLSVDRIAQEGIRLAKDYARLPQETAFIGFSGILPPQLPKLKLG